MAAATAALITTAIIGAATAERNRKAQEDAQKDAEDAQRLAEIQAEEERKRILADTKPEELQATIDFGTNKDERASTTSDFFTPLDTSKASLGTSGSTETGGLGFS